MGEGHGGRSPGGGVELEMSNKKFIKGSVRRFKSNKIQNIREEKMKVLEDVKSRPGRCAFL